MYNNMYIIYNLHLIIYTYNCIELLTQKIVYFLLIVNKFPNCEFPI